MGMSQNADIGWGVSLGSDDVGKHGSIEDVDVWDVIDKYDGLCYVSAGHCDYGYPVVILKRSNTHAYWGHKEVDSDLSVPTSEEGEVMDSFLDDISFTGDRKMKLLLVASYG